MLRATWRGLETWRSQDVSTAEQFPAGGAEENQARRGGIADLQRSSIGPLCRSAENIFGGYAGVILPV